MTRSRREFLRIGGLGVLGLTLADVLRAEASASSRAARRKARSCILLFLQGGQSQLDTFDMKPDAPAQIRGEFRPIATSVPGQRICEHMPMTARVMHRLAVIRSMNHRMRGHRSGVTNALCGLRRVSHRVACENKSGPLVLASPEDKSPYR